MGSRRTAESNARWRTAPLRLAFGPAQRSFRTQANRWTRGSPALRRRRARAPCALAKAADRSKVRDTELRLQRDAAELLSAVRIPSKHSGSTVPIRPLDRDNDAPIRATVGRPQKACPWAADRVQAAVVPDPGNQRVMSRVGRVEL